MSVPQAWNLIVSYFVVMLPFDGIIADVEFIAVVDGDYQDGEIIKKF